MSLKQQQQQSRLSFGDELITDKVAQQMPYRNSLTGELLANNDPVSLSFQNKFSAVVAAAMASAANINTANGSSLQSQLSTISPSSSSRSSTTRVDSSSAVSSFNSVCLGDSHDPNQNPLSKLIMMDMALKSNEEIKHNLIPKN